MKNTIVVFAIIAVAAVSIGVTGISASTLMTAGTPVLSSNSAMMGHLEYTLLDADGNIKSYGQTDNIVTTVGDRCIAESVFERGSSDTTATAACANANFDFIVISNNTGVTVNDALDAADDQAGTGSQDGALASVQGVVALANDNVGAGSVTATINNSAHPFTFTDSVNATNTLAQAYLMDAGCSLDSSALGTLCADGMPSGEILAGQTLSSLAISDGDSLTITWTVTIGAAST